MGLLLSVFMPIIKVWSLYVRGVKPFFVYFELIVAESHNTYLTLI